MTQSYEKFMLDRSNKKVTLILGEDSLEVTTRQLSWSVKNKIVSESIKWDTKGTMGFDGDTYMREVLKYIIVEAPWGKTDDIFLSRIGPELGTALETLVPGAFNSSGEKNPEETKK